MVGPETRQKPRTPLRVLLVEDSEDDALLLLRKLEKGGFEPEHERVETPEAMRKALAEGAWDVIFSDYMMPRLGAPEALGLARRAGSEAPFIVVSGKVGEEAAVEAMRSGAYDYVMKDNLTRLCVTVERGLKESEDLKRAAGELQRRDAVLKAVGFAAERFLGEESGWEERIEDVLERLGAATGVSRVYIFENHLGEDGEIWGSQRHEWVAPGFSAQMDNPLMQAIPYKAAGYGRWVEILGRGEPVHGHSREFPEDERPELEAQDILSIAIVPIFVEGEWWGQIGFDECTSEREWSVAEIDALKAAAGTLGTAIRRREIQEEFRQSEERYRAVIEQATDGIFLLDVGTRRILESNPAFRRMFGYTTGELGEMEIYDLVAHPRENVDSTIRRTLKERRRIVGERKYRRKDSSLIDVEVGVSVIFHGGREVICTIVRDVTERKKSEEVLRESEERFRSAFESAAIGMALVSPAGRCLRVNRPLCDILGYSERELLELTFQEITYPDDLDGDLQQMERILRGEAHAFQMEKRYIHKDGHIVWALLSVSVLRDEEGDPLYFISQVQDITGRKHAVEALKQSERLYRAVIEQATENIFLIDIETRRIVESNPAFREAVGYSEEEIKSMTLYDVVTADRESVDANVRRTLEEGRSFVGERRYRRKDGTFLDVEASASIILRDGRETLVAVAHDVTERARAQRLLEERVAALSRVSADLTLDLPVEGALDVLAESVVNTTTAVACLLTLTDEKTDALRPAGSHGMPEGYTTGLQSAYRAEVKSPTIEALRERRPVLVRDLRRFVLNDPLYAPIHHLVREVPWGILYIVPLISRGRALGAINLCYPPEQEPGEDEKIFLGAVADQTATAVDNARLFAEARGKAALEVRQRLARELHDSVSQALYGITLEAKTARALLESEPEEASDSLEYVVDLAGAGLAEMRALIFEMRPESLRTEGLVGALAKQVAVLEARHGLEVEATLRDEPEASLEVKEAAYRIAQEAIHNTVKHARAGTIRIALGADDAGISLEVADDGVGFDPEGEFPGHLGLSSMLERASRLGGTLEVDSAPAGGTCVRAYIPS